MKIDDAAKILRALADARDPITGDDLKHLGVFQQADTVRALLVACEALAKARTGETKKLRQCENSGKAWRKDEDDRLLLAFENGTSVKMLAADHGRTVSAIHARLVKLGKVQPGDTVDGLVVQPPRYDSLRTAPAA
ncbi:MAG: hypothetical protein U0136_12345 [Bdellovibrionota bacterium]